MKTNYSLVALSAACSTVATLQAAQKPNIIYILADDLGYNEIGCYGQTKIKTPNIDQIAAEGIKFTQHYSGQTVCAPSRCAMLTGKHMGHAQIRDNRELSSFTATEPAGATLAHEGQEPLKAGTVTVSKILQQNGYHTACMGKWGLGMHNTEGSPHNQGFDFFYGYLCQRHAHNYYPSHLWKTNTATGEIEQEILYAPGNGNDNVSKHGTHYATDLMSAEALTYIDERCQTENKDKPFFLYLAFPTPHVSLQVPGSDGTQEVTDPDPFEYGFSYYNSLGWNDPAHNGSEAYGAYTSHYRPRAAYAAMISRMDRDIGRIMQKLKDKGIDDNTLVIFTSDNGATFNGGSDSAFFNSVGEFRGLKCALYEGGIRIPMVARWPGNITANTTSDHISAFWDVMPTFCEMIGVQPPADTDGKSFLPTLTGQGSQSQHDYLYWEYSSYNGRQALRKGDWKAVRYNAKADPDSTVELYNLSSDIGESTNVAAQNPEKAAELAALMQDARTDSYVSSWNYKQSYSLTGTQEGFETSDAVTVTPSGVDYVVKSLDKAGMAVKSEATPITGDCKYTFTVQKGSGSGYNSTNGLLMLADKLDNNSMVCGGLFFGQAKLGITTGLANESASTKAAFSGDTNAPVNVEVLCSFSTRTITVKIGDESASRAMPSGLQAINYVGYAVNDAVSTFSPVTYEDLSPQPGNVLSFNGTSSYLQCNSYKGIIGNSPRSIEAWMKTTVNGKELVSWGTNSAGQKWVFYPNAVSSNGPLGALRVEVNGGYAVATTPVTDGEWHHVVCTFDGANVEDAKFYVDGKPDAVSNFASKAVNTVSGVNLLVSKGLSTRYWDGMVDELRIWNVALTEAQVGKLFYGEIKESGGNVLRSSNDEQIEGLFWNNLQLYYDFNGTGTEIPDKSTNGNGGTLNSVDRPSESISKWTLTPVLGFAFTAVEVELDLELKWQVEREFNVDFYRVEVRENGQWLEAAVIAAEGLSEYSHVLSNSAGKEIRVVVVDKSGFEQTFAPASVKAKVFLPLRPKWNLLSLPIKPDSLAPLFSYSSAPCWGWSYKEQCYEPVKDIEPGVGFWFFYESLESGELELSGARADSELKLQSGWNLAGPLQNSLIPENISAIYSWNDKYDAIARDSNMLVEGKGYWYFLSK